MTPEREKYISNVSGKEMMIRSNIEMLKYFIRIRKENFEWMKYDEETIKAMKRDINKYEIAIKALKRQLPVPTLKFHTPCTDHVVCGVCGCISNSDSNYCYHCGQKFRK